MIRVVSPIYKCSTDIDKLLVSCPQGVNIYKSMYTCIVDFRKILKQKPRNLPVQTCKSKSSPRCLYTFIQSREEQVSCFQCLVFHDLLDAHPMLKYDDPEDITS